MYLQLLLTTSSILICPILIYKLNQALSLDLFSPAVLNLNSLFLATRKLAIAEYPLVCDVAGALQNIGNDKL